MGTRVFRWTTLFSVVTASLAATAAGARPTAVPPGPAVRPGEVVTLPSWRDGLYVGPKMTGSLDNYANPKLLGAVRVKSNLIEEFRISTTLGCTNTESGQNFQRLFLSSHASLQTMLAIGRNGVAQARVPLTDSTRWMDTWVKVEFRGDRAKLTVRLNSMPDPETREPLVEQCSGAWDAELLHTPATSQRVPFPGFE